jgi:hypothetical protein
MSSGLKKYYVKLGNNETYSDANAQIMAAVKNPCTFQNPPPGSVCAPNAFETAPIKFVDTRKDPETGDWMANIETPHGNGLIVDAGPVNKQKIDQLNFSKRMASEWGIGGGANNKKKHRRINRRTKRRNASRRNASRRNASRRNASRRNASRRRTGKK